MRIKYNRILAIGFLVLGIVNLFLGGWITLLGEFSSSLIIGF